ncbi:MULTISPECIES: glycosyltransferase [unclassified Caballeronia]|uniref:glycosyltransferase n=1 Tax=unclassified Caballeronia TaxID=2646786 RepID=UPI002858CD4C|nr:MULTISPECIES: glycosyltransferase [unclassified Caballeronia]MDR5752719.1 glycosyltransferase [Caballeronia sp. LZ024]MDR5841361.1 glycosyltransferase [Caballeronia sp. LZ031]
MRIVHITSGLSVGGAEMMLYRLIKTSQREGVQHTVISLSSVDMLGDRIRALGVEVKILGMSRSAPNPFLLFKLVQWILAYRPDVVQTWMYHADLFGGIAACMARWIVRWRGVDAKRLTLAWGVHQTEFPPFSANKKLALIAKTCAVLSRYVPDLIVCCAEAAKRTHSAGGYCAPRMQVILNGFDLELFRPQARQRDPLRALLGVAADTPIVGIVGRVDPAKDHENFIAAIGKTSRAFPHCHYVMIGKGLDATNVELTSLIRKAKVADVCHLLGARDDVHRLIPFFDIFCLSSRSEGLPTVVGEAMACGVPCVATDVGDTATLIGATGKLVAKEDADALASGLIALLGLSDEARLELGMKARQRMQTHFSIDTSWRTYESAYERVRRLFKTKSAMQGHSTGEY